MFTCYPFLWVLRFPPVIRRHSDEVRWLLRIARRECEWRFMIWLSQLTHSSLDKLHHVIARSTYKNDLESIWLKTYAQKWPSRVKSLGKKHFRSPSVYFREKWKPFCSLKKKKATWFGMQILLPSAARNPSSLPRHLLQVPVNEHASGPIPDIRISNNAYRLQTIRCASFSCRL